MKKIKRIISLVLTLVMAVSIFTACGRNDNKENNGEESAITATAVKFSMYGKYTTTVRSDDVDLSGITDKNVEISYVDTRDALTAAARQRAFALTRIIPLIPYR